MGNERQVRSPEGMKLLAALRQLTARLPEVIEEVDGFGHTTFKAGKKSFLIVGESADGTSLSIKSDLATQASLTKRGPWVRTPYIGQHGWVTIFGALAHDWSEVEELATDAWRAVAPKKLLKQLPRE